MLRPLRRIAATVCLGSLVIAGLPDRLEAQSYPIDCAILLCLSGGWPASVPCARARAEFIRRITPWPVEPPLQIWRCPMAASYQRDPGATSSDRFYDVMFESGRNRLPQSHAASSPVTPDNTLPAVLRADVEPPSSLPEGFGLQPVQDRADIDISGPEFNFVRSIRVYHIRYARQRKSDRDDDCIRSAEVYLGTYGTQGGFSWGRSSPGALPDAHAGLTRWGEYCPGIAHRSVFVDRRDYEGNYGFEQVNY